MQTPTFARVPRVPRWLSCLLIVIVAVCVMASAPQLAPAAPEPFAQAQRLCESKLQAIFYDSSEYPGDFWVCSRGGEPFSDKLLAQAERICDRDGGIFASGFDSLEYFAVCGMPPV